MDGISTIRAYREEERYIQENDALIDSTNSPTLLLIFAARWLSIRFETLGALLTLSAGLFGVLMVGTPWFTPSLFALSMTYSLQVTGILSWSIRQFSEVEIAMNAVERVAFYGYELDQEPDHIKNENRPPANWPHNGEIEFRNVSLRYASDLPFVLHNISFSGEKNAICGRRGIPN
jgi:ABC-type multidrug transport system fused ATPase/permease subunit